MSRRAIALLVVLGPLVGCARADVPTADPEAAQLDPPVQIVEEPEPEPEPEPAAEPEAVPPEEAPAVVAKDPNTEVITFTGEDAPGGPTDQITGDPKRDPLPSMMSDIIKGPNK